MLTDAQKVAKYTNTYNGRIKSLYKGAKATASTKAVSFTLTEADLHLIWTMQSGRCVYTNWEMSLLTNDPRIASLERKDPTLGYDAHNCELICWCVNRAKNNMSKTELYAMCEAILQNTRSK